MNTGKGPRLLFPNCDCVVPDILAFRNKEVKWIEAKRKTAFAWNRNLQTWTTGIDRAHYHAYLEVAEKTQLPVYILFLHESSVPRNSDLAHGCPDRCPNGLFADRLDYLSGVVSHESGRWGSSGMVYWEHTDLTKVASIEEVQKAHSDWQKATH
jgi:hypothetical protein